MSWIQMWFMIEHDGVILSMYNAYSIFCGLWRHFQLIS